MTKINIKGKLINNLDLDELIELLKYNHNRTDRINEETSDKTILRKAFISSQNDKDMDKRQLSEFVLALYSRLIGNSISCTELESKKLKIEEQLNICKLYTAEHRELRTDKDKDNYYTQLKLQGQLDLVNELLRGEENG